MPADSRRLSQSLAGRVRNIANLHKPHIDVLVHSQGQQDGAWIHTFSTLDKIEGVVAVTAPSDTRFEKIDISFVGNSKSSVDKMSTTSAVNSTSEAFQQFLKMSQPVDYAAYPENMILKAGQTYEFPFTFVVPEHLLLNTCRHKCQNQKLKDAHLLLPPSFGDPEMAGYGGTLMDDLAPSAARISYSIRAQILRNRERDSKEMVLAEKSKKIRIVPATEEMPPMTWDDKDDEYCVRLEKSIKKGIFKAKTGRLSMDTSQPPSLRLPPPAPPGESNVQTTVAVNLRFDPTEAQSAPPKLGCLSSKLKGTTYWAARPQSRWPTRRDISSNMIASMYESTVPLSARCMANSQWKRHEPNEVTADVASRRDSVTSLQWTADEPQPTTAYKPALPYYTAKLLVPIILPKDKAWVPTFFSCLISRVYTLELSLSIPMSGGLSSSLQLRVPVQISSETAATAGRRTSLREAIVLENPEDEYFTPRRISNGRDGSSSPDEHLLSGLNQVALDSQQAPPPEYSAIPTAHAMNRAHSSNRPLQASSGLMALINAR